jgi:hypothetical protein
MNSVYDVERLFLEAYKNSYFYKLRQRLAYSGDDGILSVIEDLKHYLKYTKDDSHLRATFLEKLKEFHSFKCKICGASGECLDVTPHLPNCPYVGRACANAETKSE